MALIDNLLMCIEMDGSSWDDRSGNGFDGISEGATFDTANMLWGTSCGYFDGVNDAVRIPVPDATFVFDSSRDCTVAAWVRPVLLSGDYRIILCNHSLDTFQTIIPISASRLDLYWNVPTHYSNAISWPLNTWHHVIAMKQSAYIYMYKNNGSIYAPALHTNTVGVSASDLDIGYRTQGYSHPFKGQMMQVSVWDRALTSGERSQLYNGGAGLPFSSWGGSGAVVVPPHLFAPALGGI